MKRPVALTIVSWLFVASGVITIIGVAIDLVGHSRINIDFTVLNLWIGRWLLNLRQRGYRWAVAMLRVEFVLLPIMVVLSLFAGGPPNVSVFGYPVGHTTHMSLILFAGAVLSLAVWQYRVLQQAAARGLFSGDDENSKTGIA